MSTVISIRVRKEVKSELEKAGVDVAEEIKKRLEEMARKVRTRKQLEKWDKVLAAVKASEKGFSVKSVKKTVKVIDSSSLVKFFSREEGWDNVEKVILEGVESLDLAVKEVASALWRKVLSGEIRGRDAEGILRDLARSDVIKTQAQGAYLAGAFRIAVKNNVTIYDALLPQTISRQKQLEKRELKPYWCE